MSYAQRVLAQTEVQAGHTWQDISFRFPKVRVLLNTLVEDVIRDAIRTGEVKNLAPGTTERAIKRAWDIIERKLFKKYDTFVEFNALFPDEAFGSGAAAYFRSPKWLKDTGAIGKKFKTLAEDAAMDAL